MIWSSTSDGQITYASPEWIAFTGSPISAALGDGWLGFLHPDDREQTKSDFAKALVMQSPFTFRYRLEHIELGFIEVVTGAIPTFSPIDGSFIGYIGALTDVDHKGLPIPEKNVIGMSALIVSTAMSASTMYLDKIADHLMVARAIAVAADNARMLPSLDFAISEVMREIVKETHPTVQ